MDRTVVTAEVDFRTVAAALANLDSDEQAAFFNVFARELLHVCETDYKMETQCHAIADELVKPADDLVITLAYRFQKEA